MAVWNASSLFDYCFSEEEKRRRLLQLSRMQHEVVNLRESLAREVAACVYTKYMTEGSRNSGDLMKQIQLKVGA